MGHSREMVEALSLLTPSEVISATKLRVGNFMGDGGYVIADRLRPGQKVYSYGISNEVSFDLDLARRGLHIFMYDHTISSLPQTHPNFHFRREGISARPQPGLALFPLRHHVDTNCHRDSDMILKMDVEGAEWDVLDEIEPDLLAQFEQITMEVHEANRISEVLFRERFVRVFSKLNGIFHLIHVHSNNTAPIPTVDGMQIPLLLELSYLRRDADTATAWRTFIPTELDSSNVPGPDHVLAFYPFLPEGLAPSAFKEGLIRACELATQPFEQRIARLGSRIAVRGTNIAQRGFCTQSSLSRWSVAPDEANFALRAVKTGGLAFHTDFETDPWWKIDLGARLDFDEIICFNRLDLCSERARDLCVELSNDGATWRIIHQQRGVFGGVDGNPLRVVGPRLTARYVRLRLPGHAVLHLDGVEIYDWTADRQVSL